MLTSCDKLNPTILTWGADYCPAIAYFRIRIIAHRVVGAAHITSLINSESKFLVLFIRSR